MRRSAAIAASASSRLSTATSGRSCWASSGGTIIIAIAPRFIWWMMPILAGLVLSVPLTMLTSRASVGRWMQRRGLLLTPEETRPPDELLALKQRLVGLESAGAVGAMGGRTSHSTPFGTNTTGTAGAGPTGAGPAPTGAAPAPGGAAPAPTGAAPAPTAAALGASAPEDGTVHASVPEAVANESATNASMAREPTVEARVEMFVHDDAMLVHDDAASRVDRDVAGTASLGDGIGAARAEDIRGILSIMSLPARMPLQMEATPPVYLRPRDALTGLQRLLSAAWTPL